MHSEGEYPALNPLEPITISITEGYSVITTRSTAVIHCMQWNELSQRWDLEEHLMSQTLEMSTLELK
jgi:hypothetical protein